MRRPRYAILGIHTLIKAPAYRALPLRRIPLAVAAGVTSFIALALADPVVPYSEQRIQSRGVDIAVVLDLSASMQEPMTATANASTRYVRNVPAFEFFASVAIVLLCATFLLGSLPYFIDVT